MPEGADAQAEAVLPDPDTPLDPDRIQDASLPEMCEFELGPESTGTYVVSGAPAAVPVDEDAGVLEMGSGCMTTDNFGDVQTQCKGYVKVAPIEGGATFTFDDGAIIRWEGSTLQPRNIVAGSQLYVTYHYARTAICPFCGHTTNESLTVTRTEEGDHPYLLFGEGWALERALGVTFREVPLCRSAPFESQCYLDVRGTHYAHVLELADPVHVPYGEPTEASTPEGEFWLRWTSYSEDGRRNPNCADGRGLNYRDDVTLVRQDWALR